MPYRFHSEIEILGPEARLNETGQYVSLRDGVTHYELAGEEGGKVVVFVHGFSVPSYIWDPTFYELTRSGLRVLRYDLFGRGFSDRPNTRYDPDLFDRQLTDLITALTLKRPLVFVGISMGGPIVMNFAHRHPEWAEKLCLIDPAGLPMKMDFSKKLLLVPMLGEWIMDRFGDIALLRGQQHDFNRYAGHEDYGQKYIPQMKYVGFRNALLSTMRCGILGDHTEIYRQVGQQKCPKLLIWGRQDTTIPFENSLKIQALLPGVEFHAIEQAGHVPHYEHPDIVNPILVEFIQR